MRKTFDASDRKDDDHLDRYPLRHVWLADRPHRGFAGNRDMAAFGDESLYHPARLGHAAVSPTTVHAKETAPLRLSYTGGPDFYHCRVTQTDGHLAVCSPVWLG